MTTLSTLPPASALPLDWIAKLFRLMTLEFGDKFDRQWGSLDSEEMMAHWADSLAGYQPDEIKRGLKAMQGHDWPPTLPEFRKLCRPPPDPLVCYHEAVKGMEARKLGQHGAWSHPAVFWAAVATGSHDLLNMAYVALDRRWKRNLEDELAKGQWEPVPDVPPMIENSTSPQSREHAMQMLRELKATCVFKDANSCTGRNTAWAEKVLQRAADGDRTVTITMVEFAKEALGLIPRKGTR